MEILNYEDLKISPKTFDLEMIMRKSILKELKQKPHWDDNAISSADFALHTQLVYILEATSQSLEGKKILDLGCGSNNPYLEGGIFFKDSQFEPWLCRGLHILRFKPIGIDIGDLDKEEFEHYNTNLVHPNSLHMMSDNSIDLVNAHQFFDSPFLNLSLKANISELKLNLYKQFERILKPEGIFIYHFE